LAAKKPVIHGRDHLPGGADPIPQFITAAALPSLLHHQEGIYQMPDPGAVATVSTGSAALEWTLIDGDAVLDVSVIGTPVVITAGWYTVDIVYATTDASWNAGACIQGVLQFHQGAWAGLRLKESRSKTPAGATGFPTGGTVDTPRGECHLTGWMEPGDQITFQIDNLDSGTRDLTVDAANVSVLYLATS